jgi:DNA repair ATPase RecN
MLDIQRSQICQVYGWLAEHVGDLTHRMSEHAEENHAGYHSVKDKVRKTLRELRLPRGFEFYVMQQIRNNVRAMHEDGEWLGETVESKLEELKALGREYARAHSELPVQNEAQLMARYAAESVGEFKFSAAETFLRRLEKVIDKGREAWEQFALEDDPDWTPRSSGFSTEDFRRCAGWT